MFKKKRNNQLPENLPQLQNLIKRDPASYRDEFLQQKRHFQSMLDVFALHPSEYMKGLDEIVMFMAQVAHCYPEELAQFAEQLINILDTRNTVLDSHMRMTFCKALILLRHKGLLKPMDLLSLFFKLLRCKDKALRKFLQDHIITDTKNMNSKHKDAKLNKNLQNFMYSMLQDKNAKAAKTSLNIIIELYKKNIWTDAKTVNIITVACFSKITKVMVAALKFFISDSSPKEDLSDEDSSSDDDVPNTREVMMANKVNKKTRKRGKNLEKVKRVVEKANQKKKSNNGKFHALYLIHDPQEFAEKLFQKLEGIENKGGGKTRTERFEVKLMIWDLISRLIGVHKLFVFNFYPLIRNRLQPHQREATKFLQFVAQATHDLIPPDVMEPILKTLANNFVTEGNSSDVIAVGLNTIREICQRAPFVMNEDLLRDLVDYKHHRVHSVSMAAQSLIQVYRISMPTLLHKRDRGRPNEAGVEVKELQYGEINVKEFIPGAEVILESEEEEEEEEDDEYEDDESGSGDSKKDTISEDEEEESEVEGSDEGECVDGDDDDAEVAVEEDDNDCVTDAAVASRVSSERPVPSEAGCKRENEGSGKKDITVLSVQEQAAQRNELATVISLTKILTDEDFKRIEVAQLGKQVTSAKRKRVAKGKRDAKRKRVAVPEEEEKEKDETEFVNLADIENIHCKKRRHDKESRLQTVLRGREGREKFGYKDGRSDPFSSKTNRERNKNKNFMMIKHKMKAKVKKSFKDKQIALRNHLVKLSKMSH